MQFGTLFGGALNAIRDLWIMLMLMQAPARRSIVLDMVAKTQFIRPGRAKVLGEFVMPSNWLTGSARLGKGGAQVLCRSDRYRW